MGIYILNGRPGSGKSTFAQDVIKIVTPKFGIELSTVDLVKKIAFDLGWNGEKTLKDRKFLSDLKDLLTDWNDIPVKSVKKSIDKFLWDLRYWGIDTSQVAIFINCREPQEIKRLCEELNAKSILVRRDETNDIEVSNHADEQVFEYDYDIEIVNNGTLEELAFRALDFVDTEELYIEKHKNLKIDKLGNISYY